MKPLLRRIPSDDAFPELDARLRAEAGSARREPPPALRPRILAALRAGWEAPARPAHGDRARRTWILRLAAAVVVVAVGFWTAFRLSGTEASDRGGAVAGRRDVVQPLRRLLHPEAPRVLAQADDALVAEAEALWSDTSNVARGIVRRLPMAARLGVSPGVAIDAGAAVSADPSLGAERR